MQFKRGCSLYYNNKWTIKSNTKNWYYIIILDTYTYTVKRMPTVYCDLHVTWKIYILYGFIIILYILMCLYSLDRSYHRLCHWDAWIILRATSVGHETVLGKGKPSVNICIHIIIIHAGIHNSHKFIKCVFMFVY